MSGARQKTDFMKTGMDIGSRAGGGEGNLGLATGLRPGFSANCIILSLSMPESVISSDECRVALAPARCPGEAALSHTC